MSNQLGKKLVVSAYSLWMYDYALTLPDEINLVWSRKRSWVNALFLLSRYTMTACSLSAFPPDFMSPDFAQSPCLQISLIPNIFSFVNYVSILAMLVLRAYALYGGALWIGALLGMAAIICLVVCAKTTNFQFNAPFNGCSIRHQAVNFFVMFAIQTAMFAITLVKTLPMALALRRLHCDRGIAFYLLRDGTIYYTLMIVPYLFTIAITYTPPISKEPSLTGILTPFVTVFRNISMGRLVFDLRRLGSVALDDTGSVLPSPSIRFRSAGQPANTIDERSGTVVSCL